jgi:hypothetical protein
VRGVARPGMKVEPDPRAAPQPAAPLGHPRAVVPRNPCTPSQPPPRSHPQKNRPARADSEKARAAALAVRAGIGLEAAEDRAGPTGWPGPVFRWPGLPLSWIVPRPGPMSRFKHSVPDSRRGVARGGGASSRSSPPGPRPARGGC